MSGFMGFFDCLFGRRIAEILAGRAEDEPNSIRRELPGEGYQSQPAPTAGDPSRTSISSHQNVPCSCPCRTVNANNRTDLAALDLAAPEYLTRYQLERPTPPNRKGFLGHHSANPLRHNELRRYDLNVFHHGGIEDHLAARPSRGIDWSDMPVIEALWHCSTPGPRETSWNDFKYTMGRLGFAVEREKNGSWKFRASKPSDFLPVELMGRSITTHSPHNGKDTFGLSVMRDIGRRLTNTFGLTGESFKDMF
ncbi:hypothetical protein F4678DRAFT_419381 [Xylaria arbuscula]|nr:hypothetical protein F4678DRAFT_419381 [Xylaria arbuscula]